MMDYREYQSRKLIKMLGAFDTCECGDYRRDHPGNGACVFGSNHGVPKELHYASCAKFILNRKATEFPTIFAEMQS